MLIRVIVINTRSLPAWKYLTAVLVDWGKCFCVLIWLGISSELCSNDPKWKVLQEQIWRRYPVNKEPAETSCEQHHMEMCDFKQGLLVTDSWWSVYHSSFLLLLNMALKERQCTLAVRRNEKWMFVLFLCVGSVRYRPFCRYVSFKNYKREKMWN